MKEKGDDKERKEQRGRKMGKKEKSLRENKGRRTNEWMDKQTPLVVCVLRVMYVLFQTGERSSVIILISTARCFGPLCCWIVSFLVKFGVCIYDIFSSSVRWYKYGTSICVGTFFAYYFSVTFLFLPLVYISPNTQIMTFLSQGPSPLF